MTLPLPDIVPPVLFMVAHWDDEIISTGGTLLLYGKGADVVCSCKKTHVLWQQKVFAKLCRNIGARSITLNINQRPTTIRRDQPLEQYCSSVPHVNLGPKLANLLPTVLDRRKYRTIFTHNLDGDLGRHDQHVQVAQAVLNFFQGASVFCISAPPSNLVKADDMRVWLQAHSSHCLPFSNEICLTKLRYVKRYKPESVALGMLGEEYYIQRRTR